MNPDSEKSPVEGEPAIPHAWAVVLSVMFVLAGLFIGLPLCLSEMPSVAARIPVVLLLVPAFPAVTGWLQGCMDSRLPGESGLRALPREYLLHLWSLALELTVVLATLPLIAAQITGVGAAVMLLAFGAVVVLACLQQVFGLHMEGVATFGGEDVWVAGKVLLGSVGVTVAAFGLGMVLERVFDRSADVTVHMNRRVLRWLRDHV